MYIQLVEKNMTIDTLTFTAYEAEIELKQLLRAGCIKTLMLSGPAGCGKVSALHNAAEMIDHDVCEVDLFFHDIGHLYNSITHAEKSEGNTVMIIDNITSLSPVLQMQLLKRMLLESTTDNITFVFVVTRSAEDSKRVFSNFFLNRMVHLHVEN